MISIALRHYRSRFGWEIAAFWLISGVNSVLLARHAVVGLISAMAVLEIIALVWITVRLVLAEDGFKTSGGWRTRPFPKGLRTGLPLVAACVVVLVPAILRALVYQRMFGDASVWTSWGEPSWLRQLWWWLVFCALPLKLFGTLILRAIDGRGRIAAWTTLAIVLLPVTASLGTYFGKRGGHYGNTGGGLPRLLAQGIQRELLDATDFIGTWNDPTAEESVPAARLVARISIDSKRSSPGIAVSAGSSGLRGSRVLVRVRGYLRDRGMVPRLKDAIAVLRYADGTYASCQQDHTSDPGSPLPFFPVSEWRFSGDFVSPLSLPEFEGDPQELTRGLELLFFEPDWNKPQLKVDPRRKQNRSDNAEVFRFQPATMDELFTQFPWPDDVWEKTGRPFLLKRATEKDVAFLLERLEMDNRLMAMFIGKGWRDEAMPVLRKLLKERIPMGIECIEELAKEQDPSLAEDLKSVALHHTRGLERLEKALRSQPGFDWRGYVLEAWKRQKYSNNWLEPWGEFWIFALWAAREGDFTAFRLTAERAALGKTWEQQQLAGLVAGNPPDMLEFLRRNIDTMKFDAETRRWFVPAG